MVQNQCFPFHIAHHKTRPWGKCHSPDTANKRNFLIFLFAVLRKHLKGPDFPDFYTMKMPHNMRASTTLIYMYGMLGEQNMNNIQEKVEATCRQKLALSLVLSVMWCNHPCHSEGTWDALYRPFSAYSTHLCLPAKLTNG
jgi:hypothetical protein